MYHSYTTRLQLQITDSNVNVGMMIKKMFTLWKDADSSVNNEIKKNIMPGMYQYNGKLHTFSGHIDSPSQKKRFSRGKDGRTALQR